MKTIFFTTIILLFVGCQTQLNSSIHLELDRIYFGHGGGFSGKVDQWVLSSNGRLFHLVDINKEKDSIIFIKKLSKKITKDLFNECIIIEQNFKSVQDPFNTYSFIRFENSSKNVIYTWNDNTSDIEPLKSLYTKLYDQTL
jgi:hypothetical protein